MKLVHAKPTSHTGVVQVPGTLFQVLLPADCFGGRKIGQKYLGSCPPHGRFGWSLWLKRWPGLALAVIGFEGVTQKNGTLSFCVCLPSLSLCLPSKLSEFCFYKAKFYFGAKKAWQLIHNFFFMVCVSHEHFEDFFFCIYSCKNAWTQTSIIPFSLNVCNFPGVSL